MSVALAISIIALCIALYALSETFEKPPDAPISNHAVTLAEAQAWVRTMAHDVGSKIYGLSAEEAEIYAGTEPEDANHVIRWYKLAYTRITAQAERMEGAKANGEEIASEDLCLAEKLCGAVDAEEQAEDAIKEMLSKRLRRHMGSSPHWAKGSGVKSASRVIEARKQKP